MPGYLLIERQTLSLGRNGGIEPYSEELGFLDFLRELASEPFPFPRLSQLRVVGVEEILFAARPEHERLALEIHRRLRQAAPDLESRVISVQVVFHGQLIRGESLWSEYRGQRLPVGHIFGSPPAHEDERGNRFYTTNFNLTHG